MSHAIIGLGCRLPGAESPQDFWALLSKGESAVSNVPADRWDADELHKTGKIASRVGGFLKRVDLFDPEAFGVPVKYFVKYSSCLIACYW